MSNESFFKGGVYVRDYTLAALNGLMNGVMHTSPCGSNDTEYQAYLKIYKIISDKFGDMFEPIKA